MSNSEILQEALQLNPQERYIVVEYYELLSRELIHCMETNYFSL